MSDNDSAPLFDFAVALTGSVSGAIFGGLSSLLIIGIANRSKKLDSIRSSIKDVKRYAVVYWEHDARLIEFETKIKLSLEDLDSDLQRTFLLKWKRRIMQDGLDELSNLCTGGTFETSDKERNTNTAYRIRRCCNELLTCL